MAAFLAALPLLAVSMIPTHATTGCGRSSLEEQVDRADLIVLGTTISSRDLTLTSPDFPFDLSVLVMKVAVDGYVKGSGPATIEHETLLNVEGNPFFTEIGDRDLLLLRSRDDGSYVTSVCAGNRTVTSENEQEVQARITEIGQILHPGTDVANLPAPAPPLDPGSRDFVPGVLLAAAAFGALLAAGALLFARRPG